VIDGQSVSISVVDGRLMIDDFAYRRNVRGHLIQYDLIYTHTPRLRSLQRIDRDESLPVVRAHTYPSTPSPYPDVSRPTDSLFSLHVDSSAFDEAICSPIATSPVKRSR
jgi:hypothetical protein